MYEQSTSSQALSQCVFEASIPFRENSWLIDVHTTTEKASMDERCYVVEISAG